jgi:hypothetical protein
MISVEALRGYVLEEVLARLLWENGYTLLVRASQDENALRDGRHGGLCETLLIEVQAYSGSERG